MNERPILEQAVTILPAKVRALRFDERNPPPIAEPQGAGDSPEVVDLPVVSVADLAGKPIPPRRWIIPDLIPHKTVTIIAGDGGDGKTTAVLQLAAAMAASRPWLGYNPEPGPVVFVSTEDDLDELHRRLSDIAVSLGVALADLGDLHLVPLAGKNAVLGAPQGRTEIVTATAVFLRLVALVERLKPRLVVLDALADVFGGEENARAQARQFVGLLRGLAIDHDLAVILIAHPSQTGMASGSGTSGSTAWSNSVRSRLYLERVKDGNGREIDPNLRVLRLKKANYAATGMEIRIRWHRGAFVLDGPVSGFDRMAVDAKADHVFLDMLAEFTRQERDVSPNPSRTYAPTVFSAHPDGDGVPKKALEGAMNRHLKSGRVRIEHFGAPSRRRSRLVAAPAEEAEL